MSDFEFRPDHNIFQNRDALTEQYTPEELVGRDEELREYHAALQPVINGESPSNIFLYGKSGVGKTAATRFLLNNLQRDAEAIEDLSLTTIELNCDGLNTSYQTVVRLVNTLREPGREIANTGYPLAEVYEYLWEALESLSGTVLIVLDEIDHINDDSILYQLPRARNNGNIESVKLGVIGISNDLSFRDSLSSKVRSSLCEKEVSFSAYNATELQKVLRQRERVAFQDDTLDQGVIEMCAAYGAKDSGDARQALDLLLEAGDVARQQEAERVTESHVETARNRLKRNQVEEGISKLSPHGKLVLSALCHAEEDENTPVRTRELRATYEGLCDDEGMDPISNRSIRDHLAELEQLGIVSSSELNRGKGGGKFKEHELDQSVESVRTGLSLVESQDDGNPTPEGV